MRRAYIALGIIGVLGVAALVVLFTYPSPKSQRAPTTITNPLAASSMELTSTTFTDNSLIPSKYTCDAGGTAPNPPLTISHIPSGTKSLALIMDDPDVPKQIKADGVFDHWVLYNVHPPITDVLTGDFKMEVSPQDGVPGLNGAGTPGYYPPCPPKEYEPSQHRYVFTAYALDTTLTLAQPPTKDELRAAMEGHTLAQSTLTGVYKRP